VGEFFYEFECRYLTHIGDPTGDIWHGSKCRSPKCRRTLVQVIFLWDRPEELMEGHIRFPLIVRDEADDKLLAELNGGDIPVTND
jgi:hypothetical protein